MHTPIVFFLLREGSFRYTACEKPKTWGNETLTGWQGKGGTRVTTVYVTVMDARGLLLAAAFCDASIQPTDHLRFFRFGTCQRSCGRLDWLVCLALGLLATVLAGVSNCKDI
jgi:hypothetical protein